MAQNLCGEDHIIKGTSIHVSNAVPKNETANFRARRMDSRASGNIMDNYNGSSPSSFVPRGVAGGPPIWQSGIRTAGNDLVAHLGNSLGIGNQNSSQGAGKGVNTTPPTLSMGALNLGAALPLSSVVAAALGQAGFNLFNSNFSNPSSDAQSHNSNVTQNTGHTANTNTSNTAGGSSGYVTRNQGPDNMHGQGQWSPRNNKRGFGLPTAPN